MACSPARQRDTPTTIKSMSTATDDTTIWIFLQLQQARYPTNFLLEETKGMDFCVYLFVFCFLMSVALCGVLRMAWYGTALEMSSIC